VRNHQNFSVVSPKVNLQELADTYVEAWNHGDVDLILSLMHEGVSIYDAFWRETCVGQDVPQYLRDIFDEENFFYERIGAPIATEDGIIIRYAAHERNGSEIGAISHTGADVITLRDGKILTVSDFYCEPDIESLKEVARLAARRHGETRYANAGISALKSWLVREQLLELITENEIYRDPDLTLAEAANRINCSTQQLNEIVSTEFKLDFDSLIDFYRVNHARNLLLRTTSAPNFMLSIATQSGFNSLDAFYDAFARSFGMTPREYQLLNRAT